VIVALAIGCAIFLRNPKPEPAGSPGADIEVSGRP
jgi:hypothetical protein